MCSSSSAEAGVQRAPCGCTYCAGCIVRMFMYATKREPYEPLRCCRIEFPMELAGTAFARVDAARTAAGPAAPAMSAGAGAGAQGNNSNNTTAAPTAADKGKGKDKGKGNDRDRDNGRDKGKGRERAIPPQQPQRRAYTCAACLETFPLNDVMVVPGCRHSYCVPCMHRLFTESARSEDLFPPRCCRQPVPIVWANLILSTEEQDVFYKRKEEWKTPGHARLYCARPACAAFIPPLRVFAAAGYGACEKCPARTCVHCKGAFHGNEACPRDKETQDVLSLAQTEGWRKCYSCNMMVELDQGCNHITCR
ncbi:hypothetical protein DFP73DRAFT_556271 [Morchella snyderi]|nr:hypothetical protein DFP73DRAFT_556271 [Morchella snyderi]